MGVDQEKVEKGEGKMEKGRGKGTNTLHRDNDYLRRGDVKRLLENVVCLHEELPAQIDLIPAADVRPVIFCRDCTHCFQGKESLECEKHRYAWNDARRWVNEDDYCCWGKKREIEHD